MAKFPITAMFDMEQKRVGCVLIQSMAGCSIDSFTLQLIGTESWLLAPNSKLQMYTIFNKEELDAIILLCKEARDYEHYINN